jgi:hypothetical protein
MQATGIHEESTAASLTRELLGKGVQPERVTSEHIMHVYKGLKKSPAAPDFSSIDALWPTQLNPCIDETCPLLGVIVETRKHPAIERVINNIVANVGIPVQVFHGKSNLEFVMATSIGRLVQDGKVYVNRLDIDELSAKKYNALLLTKRFWENVRGRNKILVFQTDTTTCSRSDYTIEDFMSYDYIGSKWPRRRPVGLILDGGNGGLSLRDWKKTYDCLERFPPQYWIGGEDGYFSFHIDLIGGKVGKGDECAKFCTQLEFSYRSWGAHQISRLGRDAQAEFLNYCDEAGFMLEDANRQLWYE